MGVVITLVILLIVALVIIGFVTDRFQGAREFVSCTGQGGTCFAQDVECPPGAGAIFTSDCREAGLKCCVPTGG